eukprot:3211614-Rhodomonas_salina.1
MEEARISALLDECLLTDEVPSPTPHPPPIHSIPPQYLVQSVRDRPHGYGASDRLVMTEEMATYATQAQVSRLCSYAYPPVMLLRVSAWYYYASCTVAYASHPAVVAGRTCA